MHDHLCLLQSHSVCQYPINRYIHVPITNPNLGEELDAIEIVIFRRERELVSISPKKQKSRLDCNIEEFDVKSLKHDLIHQVDCIFVYHYLMHELHQA